VPHANPAIVLKTPSASNSRMNNLRGSAHGTIASMRDQMLFFARLVLQYVQILAGLPGRTSIGMGVIQAGIKDTNAAMAPGKACAASSQ